MRNFLKYFQLVLSLVPAVGPIVQDVEALHANKPGTEKKALVMDIIGNAAGAAMVAVPGQQVAVQEATQAASSAVDIAVAFYNKSGLFKKSTPATPATPAPAQ